MQYRHTDGDIWFPPSMVIFHVLVIAFMWTWAARNYWWRSSGCSSKGFGSSTSTQRTHYSKWRIFQTRKGDITGIRTSIELNVQLEIITSNQADWQIYYLTKSCSWEILSNICYKWYIAWTDKLERSQH